MQWCCGCGRTSGGCCRCAADAKAAGSAARLLADTVEVAGVEFSCSVDMHVLVGSVLDG